MPSKSEWESQKDVIRELYLNQDYTLKALQDRMNSAGFVATKSQYETKFKAWGFSKNDTDIPAATWKHVGYKIAKRKREDEDSAVFIGGVEVNHKRVKKEISRYTYSTIERVQLERIGAPSPPGPLAIVATPPSSEPAFIIKHWPENLPWLAFVRSLNTTLSSFHQANKTSRMSPHGMSTKRPRAQPGFSLRNDTTSISGDWQRLAHIITGRERLNLIQAILPHSSDLERVAEMQNSMTLLSTTSSHWALKLLIYLASNNMLQPEDLDQIWRLVEETGIKELAKLSESFHPGEKSLTAAMEYLFEAGVWAYRTDIVSWLLDIGIDPNRRIRPQDMQVSHLPLVVTLHSKFRKLPKWTVEWTAANSMARLLVSKGASTLLRCCEDHITATNLVIMNHEVDAETLELFLQAARRVQSNQPSSQYPNGVAQEDGANHADFDAQETQDTAFIMLELLVDTFEKILDAKFLSLTTMVSPGTLIEAVKSKHHRLIRVLHRRGLSMNCCDGSHRSPLLTGLECGADISSVELLLDLGASPNYDPCSDRKNMCSRTLQTAIHSSLTGTQAEVVRVLIRNGATVQGSVSCGHDNHQNLMHCALRADAKRAQWIDEDVPLLLHDAGLPFPKTCLLDHMEAVYTTFVIDIYDRATELKALLPILISETTDMSQQSKIGWTALDYALVLEMEEAGDLMFDKGAVHSHKFISDYCLFSLCQLGVLETVFRRAPTPTDDRQKSYLLFCRVIGTIRARDSPRVALASGVRDLLQEYCKLPRSRTHEADIILQACVTGNVFLIGLVLELFPSTYSPIALEVLIGDQTERGIDNWDFIEELLKRRLIVSPYLQRLQKTRMFLHAVFDALTCKGNAKILDWLFDNSGETFELPNVYCSAVMINVSQMYYWSPHRPLWSQLSELNMDNLYKYNRTTSTYLGLLAVYVGQVDQISDLLHHGMRPNRRFAWSLTFLQLAVTLSNLQISRRLLEAGADVNGRAPWRDIPISILPKIPFEFCRKLSTGAFTPYTNRRSALQIAVEQGNLSMVSLLLENGADLDGPPARVGGATAIQIASIKGYIDIAKLLIEKGADINGVGAEYFGRTALEGAAEHGRLDTVSLLLKSGCLVHGAFRKQYIRAVGFAKAQTHYTVAKELQDYGEWTNNDEDALNSTDLSDIEPGSRDLEEDLQDDDDISEVDSEDLQLWNDLDPSTSRINSKSESEDYSSATDSGEAICSEEDTSQENIHGCDNSERGNEPPAVRRDDMLGYYGDDKGV